MTKLALFLLCCALGLSAEDKPAAPKPIDSGALLRMALLQKDAEILRLTVCGEALVKPSACIVDWQAGTVSERKPEPPKPAEAEPKKK